MTDELRDLDWACHRILNDPVLRRYSTDASASRTLEDEIERRGLAESYVIELTALVGDTHVMMINHAMWLTLRATPEQRAHAFLTAMSGNGKVVA